MRNSTIVHRSLALKVLVFQFAALTDVDWTISGR
jgi:hypothetical protein